MKIEKSDIPALVGAVFIVFLLGALFGSVLMRHDVKSRPRKYGLYAKDTRPECTCLCSGGATHENYPRYH